MNYNIKDLNNKKKFEKININIKIGEKQENEIKNFRNIYSKYDSGEINPKEFQGILKKVSIFNIILS